MRLLFYGSILRLVQACNRCGDVKQAKVLLDFAFERSQDNFSPRPHAAARLRALPVFGDVRRKPTPAELRRGVPIDEEGFVDKDPRLAKSFMSDRRQDRPC